jgi:hypothetical protein
VRRSIVGSVRSLEVTYGENGWHPHHHVLLFIKPGVVGLDDDLQAIVTDWRDLVGSSLGSVPSVERGVDLTYFGQGASAAAAYVAKIAKEITLADSKSGRDPLALLDDRSKESAAKWFEFVDSMKGRQSIAWSKGLRSQLELPVEVADELLADEYVSLDGESEPVEIVVVVDRRKWNSLIMTGAACDYLQRFEDRLAIERRRVHRE